MSLSKLLNNQPFGPTEMMSFPKLPNEMLELIINGPCIPLKQRIRLRGVCKRWAVVLEDRLQKETTLGLSNVRCNRGSYDSDFCEHPEPKPDDLVIRCVTDKFIQLLARLFPSTSELTFYFESDCSSRCTWNQLPSLLTHLAANLEIVNLYGCCEDHDLDHDHEESFPVNLLADALNALLSLSSLSLPGRSILSNLLPLLAPSLSRLEKFSCSHAGYENASIISSAISPRCTHLMLDYDVFYSFSGAFLQKLSTHLTHLHLIEIRDHLWPSISQLTGLVSLAFSYLFSPADLDSSQLRFLAPFKYLTDVKVFGLSYSTPLELPSEEAPALPTIKRISLQVRFPTDPNSDDEMFADSDSDTGSDSDTDSASNPAPNKDAALDTNSDSNAVPNMDVSSDTDSDSDAASATEAAVDFAYFFKAIHAWFPNVLNLSLFIHPSQHLAAKAALGQLPFTVKILDTKLADHRLPAW